MKEKITVPNISKYLEENKDYKNVLKLLDYNHIDQNPWNEPNKFRNVRFKIAHNNHNLYLIYDVIEPEMVATYINHNDPVYKDSCVEFFIAFEEDSNYYNFEFNPLGTCLMGWGTDRNNRKLLDTNIIDLIEVKTKIKRINNNGLTSFNWKILIKIPLKTFKFNKINSLKNISATANFYKCGDGLSKPHYMTWNPIKSEKPNFHLKSYFGEIEFE